MLIWHYKRKQRIWKNIYQINQKNRFIEISEWTETKKSSVGAGSDTWFVTCADGKYVVKYPSDSDINNPEREPELCEFLLKQGIPACQFIKNVQGQYLSYSSIGENAERSRSSRTGAVKT